MEFPSDQEIDLSRAEPPPKALLLACKQIHCETKVLHKASFRSYWSSSRFILHHNAQAPKVMSREAIVFLPIREMQHINHLRILTSGAGPTDVSSAYLVHPNGGWALSMGERARPSFRRYRVWLWRAHPKAQPVVVPTKAGWDGSGSEEELRTTCERIGSSVPMINQVLHLLELELEDLEGVWQKW